MRPPLDSVPTADIAGDERALNDRRAAILEAVVTEYIGTAEPVEIGRASCRERV